MSRAPLKTNAFIYVSPSLSSSTFSAFQYQHNPAQRDFACIFVAGV
jgi:hypothetical protein